MREGMTAYTPDNWIVLCMHIPDYKHYRVLASWYGGYGGSDSWQINSGIVKCEQNGNYFNFFGESGSVYKCHKDKYKVTSIMASPLHMFEAQDIDAEIMQPDTNWEKMQWHSSKPT